MTKQCVGVLVLAVCVATPAAAQDAKAVLAAASKAMGMDNLTSITIYGTGANYNLGQSNNSNDAWPRNNLNDYARSIDFVTGTSRATAVTWGAPVTGGPAAQGAFQQNIGPNNMAWAQQLEIWTTPWGFIKGAIANSATMGGATAATPGMKTISWMTTQKAPSGASYKVVGYINNKNLVARVDTWLENPVFGDMLVENDYSNYREALGGVMYPATIVQKRGGSPVFDAQILGAKMNPENIAQLVTPPPPPAGRGGGPGGPGGPAGAPPAASSEKLADGVYRITGGYIAMAIEMKDHIVLFEGGPQNEARSQAIIAEAKRVIPNKPIRYSILTHHHFDHSSGLPAVVAEGTTIVTHANNKAFLTKALTAPRTLAPDSMSKSGKKPVIETVQEKRVMTDGSRTIEIYHVQGLPHAEGMLVVYLPKERILGYADMFNAPAPNDPVPNPPVVGTQVFVANVVDRLKLDFDTAVSVHAPNPDRNYTKAEILKSLGRNN
jgi:glyoxylase-like metal-dependent hydrolase (beta-lactamase superfamily II)